MNVIVSIGRDTPNGPLNDKQWYEYITKVGAFLHTVADKPAEIVLTSGESHYSHNETLLYEESFTWALTLGEDDIEDYIRVTLELIRTKYSGGQWGIALTFGHTEFV